MPMLDEFTAHWALVNTELGASGPMLLKVGPATAPESVTLAACQALRAELAQAQGVVQTVLNNSEIKSSQVKLDKRMLLDDAQSFGRKVRAEYPGASPYVMALPELPSVSAGQEVFLNPLRDVRDVWEKVDGAGPAVVLPSGKDFGDFVAELTALEALWQALKSEEVSLRVAREKRNALQVRAEAVLGRYRPTVEALLAPENPLVTTIPRLRPLAGRTPDPVALTAVWDAAEGKARLTWTASKDDDLEAYQIRMSPTEEYDADAESVLATLAPAAPREFLTTAGLPTAGDSASYKVYVIVGSGNEAGSPAVTVTRP